MASSFIPPTQGKPGTRRKSASNSLLIDGVFLNAKVGWVAGIKRHRAAYH